MILHRLILVSAVMLGSSCAAEELSCPRVAGQFQALYTPLQGTCGYISDPLMVLIDDKPQSVQTNILMFGNGRLTTDIVMMGCSVQMTQQFESVGKLETYIAAPELAVESANELSGQISMWRYDTVGNLACSGVYDARFVKETATTGAAVVGAAAGVR
jgi:hypothetical protein